MSHVVDEDETYTYEILQEKHLEESTHLLADTFTKTNPLEVYLKTSYEQFHSQALAFSKAVLDEQLSIVAIHKQSKEIHGLVQAGDAKKLEGRDSEGWEQSKDAEVFSELEKRFKEYYGEVKENDLIQIMALGIRPDCSGKGQFSRTSSLWKCLLRLTGLATKLQRVLFAHCRQRGFKHAVVEPGNPASYHIYAKKLNGKVITSIHLPTFVSSNGQNPFEDYDADVQVILLDLWYRNRAA